MAFMFIRQIIMMYLSIYVFGDYAAFIEDLNGCPTGTNTFDGEAYTYYTFYKLKGSHGITRLNENYAFYALGHNLNTDSYIGNINNVCEILSISAFNDVNVVDDDFVGPLPTGNDFIKKLKLADGTTIVLEDDNVIEKEGYSDDLLAELEKEGKIKKTANGEEELLLKSTDTLTLTDRPIDIFDDPYKDLTGYEEKEITAEKPIAIEDPVLDTTLDTTDIFTTVKSFFLNFWTNTKAIFSNLWQWLRLIYNAILNIGKVYFSLSGFEDLFSRLCVMREDYIKDKMIELFEGYSQSLGNVRDNLMKPFVIQQKEIPDIVVNDITYVNNQYIRDNIGIIREILQSFVTLLFVAGVVKSFLSSFGNIFYSANEYKGGNEK